MARCINCGKSGFFLHLNACGYCSTCEDRKQAEEKRVARIHALELQRKTEYYEKVQRFRKNFFPTTSSNSDVQHEWSFWTEAQHGDTEQIDRQKKALYNTIPFIIDTHLRTSNFVSSLCNNIYNTDLVSCTCPDFQKRNLPCKHMYALFYALTHDSAMGITDIPRDIKDKFFNLDENTRLDFLQECRWMRPCGRHIFITNAISSEVEQGLLTKSPPHNYEGLLQKMTKDEIILSLAKRGIKEFKPSWSKVKLVDWVLNEQPSYLKKQFPHFVHVEISPDAKNWATGIQESFSRYSPYKDIAF